MNILSHFFLRWMGVCMYRTVDKFDAPELMKGLRTIVSYLNGSFPISISIHSIITAYHWFLNLEESTLICTKVIRTTFYWNTFHVFWERFVGYFSTVMNALEGLVNQGIVKSVRFPQDNNLRELHLGVIKHDSELMKILQKVWILKTTTFCST